MERDELKRIYARCDPDEPLETSDERYVDVDQHLGDGGRRPRRYAWVNRIARQFELASDPHLVLLTGLPGSGKSTELRRVLAKLRAAEGAGLFPVLIDADDSIDLRAPLDLPELIITILVESERRILIELEGVAEDKVDGKIAQDSVASRLWTWLSTTEVELQKFDIGVHGQKLSFELRSNPSFKQRVRKTIGRRLTDFMRHARGYMDELSERVRQYEINPPKQQKYRGLIVALDSLEKLRGLSSNAREVLESAEHVFRELDVKDLGVPAIFTVPAALATRRYLDVEFMPVIKIRDREGEDYAPGRKAMRELIDRRMKATEQAAVFGEQLVPRVDAMIEQSGGYPRELIKMLQEALRAEEFPLSERDFKVLLGARADGYRRLVRGDLIELLKKIHTEKPALTIPREALGEPEHFDLLLMNSLVMLYQNDVEWTDVNPAILPMILPS